jgi:hypothetical protein
LHRSTARVATSTLYWRDTASKLNQAFLSGPETCGPLILTVCRFELTGEVTELPDGDLTTLKQSDKAAHPSGASLTANVEGFLS